VWSECAELLGPHVCVCVCVLLKRWWIPTAWLHSSENDEEKKTTWLLHSSQCCGPYSKLVSKCDRRGIWQIVDNCGSWLHLRIWDTVIIVCCRHCKTKLMWTVHIVCNKWNIIFEENLLIFQDKSSVMYWEMFSEGVRPA